mmetsp:Transcript_128631/g.320801  ORF Transcript_128631/g.320801 Transcript_128631/m.320801 type:complete len:178 (+) Transcript_128631:95-628(+)
MAEGDMPGESPMKKRRPRLSFADNVADAHEETSVSLGEAGEHRVRLGLLRLGNVYRTSVPLPVAANDVELLPFLSTSLEAAVEPRSVDGAPASLLLTFSAQREGRFAETLRLRLDAESPGAEPRQVRVEGAVMGRDAGKPLPRRGVVCISEAQPEDLDTEAGTAWEGFGKAGQVGGD